MQMGKCDLMRKDIVNKNQCKFRQTRFEPCEPILNLPRSPSSPAAVSIGRELYGKLWADKTNKLNVTPSHGHEQQQQQ